MKKMILILILGLSILAGGYFFLPSEQIKEFTQYIPKPISELFGINQKDNPIVDSMPSNAIEVSRTPSIVSPEPEESPKELSNKPELPEEIVRVEPVEEKHVDYAVNDIVVEEINNEILENDSPEVIKIKKRLEKVKSLIDGFDDTNTALKTRFDKIIKENKALALELKKINDQIKLAQ